MSFLSAVSDTFAAFIVPRGRCLECGQLGLTDLYPMPIHDDRCGECMELESNSHAARENFESVMTELTDIYRDNDARLKYYKRVNKLQRRRMAKGMGITPDYFKHTMWAQPCAIGSFVRVGGVAGYDKVAFISRKAYEPTRSYRRAFGNVKDTKPALENECVRNGITPRKSWTRKQLVQALMKI